VTGELWWTGAEEVTTYEGACYCHCPCCHANGLVRQFPVSVTGQLPGGVRGHVDQSQMGPAAAKTVAKAIAVHGRRATRLEHRPRGRTLLDGYGRPAHAYGSEGWGSNPSERAHVTAGQRVGESGPGS
jgi:hypothetical protein